MTTRETSKHYLELVAWLRARRDSILAAWRKSIRADIEQLSARTLSRSQLNDHIPNVLDDFENSLAKLGRSGSEGSMEDAEGSIDHGLHRWQQGYELHELTKEWGHLHLLLLEQLEAYAISKAEIPQEVMLGARRVLAELCIEGISSSTECYFDLHRREAEGHVKDLEEAIRDLNELERRRAELWRGAAHDLRGSVAAVKSASTLVTKKKAAQPTEEQFQEMLQRSVASLQRMLNSVMDLSRLQAGSERPNIAPFDAAQLLREAGESFHIMAEESGLTFTMEGPESLEVQGDAQKVARIAQNLILNAIKYTKQGGINVTWSSDTREPMHPKWSFTVIDTGPGIRSGPGSPLTPILKEATDVVREADGRPPAPTPPMQAAHHTSGEGIGLSIVKGLCNLLHGNIELEASKTGGTIFRITFPAEYPEKD